MTAGESDIWFSLAGCERGLLPAGESPLTAARHWRDKWDSHRQSRTWTGAAMQQTVTDMLAPPPAPADEPPLRLSACWGDNSCEGSSRPRQWSSSGGGHVTPYNVTHLSASGRETWVDHLQLPPHHDLILRLSGGAKGERGSRNAWSSSNWSAAEFAAPAGRLKPPPTPLKKKNKTKSETTGWQR